MKTIRYISVLLFLCGWQLCFAQKTLTVEDCKTLALKNNIQFTNSKLSVEAAGKIRQKAYTAYFPIINVSGTYFKSDKNLFTASVGPMVTDMFDETIYGGLSLTQPIYTGGKISAANELAEINSVVNNIQLKLKRNEILHKTEELFWLYHSLQEKQITIREYEKLLNKLLNKVNDAFKGGLAIKNDVLKVQIALSELKINKSKLENGIRLSRLALCKHIGLPFSSDKEFRDSLIINKSLDEIYITPEEAVIKRYEMQLLSKAVEAEKLKTTMTRGDLLPQIGVSVNGFYLDLLDNKGDFYSSVMGNISIPISDWWGGSYELSERSIQEDISRNNKKDSKELMVLQIHKAWNDLFEKNKQIELANEILIQTKENLRVNNDSYEAGIIEIADLLEAKAKHFEASDRVIEAKANYKVQQLEYLRVTGELL